MEEFNAQIENLVKRANLALEDGEFDKARAFSEQILNIDVEYAQAYVIALLCDMRALDLTALATHANLAQVFNNGNYKKAVRFATGELKTALENVEKYCALTKIKEIGLLGDQAYELVKRKLKELEGFKPAEEYLENLDNLRDKALEKQIRSLLAKQVYTVDGYIDAIKDENKKKELKNFKAFLLYNKAGSLMEAKRYIAAKENFLEIKDYKDAEELAAKCEALYLRGQADLERQRKEAEEFAARKKKREQIALIIIAGVLALGVAVNA